MGFAVSALAVVALLRQVPLDQLAVVLARSQPLFLLGLVTTVPLGLLARAARWQVFFEPKRHLPILPLFGTVSISYMTSLLLPLRGGEIVRAALTNRREHVPIAEVVATILLEKLFDFLAIGLMLALLLIAVPLPTLAVAAGSTITVVILVGFGAALMLCRYRTRFLRLLASAERSFPFGLGTKVGLVRLADRFADGTASLANVRLWIPMLGWTLIAWLLSLASAWLAGAAVGRSLGTAELAFLLVLTSTGQAVPSSPGYIGVFHAAAVVALTAFGVDPITALAIAVVLHTFSWGTMLLLGMLSLWLSGYRARDILVSTRGRGLAPSPG